MNCACRNGKVTITSTERKRARGGGEARLRGGGAKIRHGAYASFVWRLVLDRLHYRITSHGKERHEHVLLACVARIISATTL